MTFLDLNNNLADGVSPQRSAIGIETRRIALKREILWCSINIVAVRLGFSSTFRKSQCDVTMLSESCAAASTL